MHPATADWDGWLRSLLNHLTVRDIKVVLPLPPGGAGDIIARLLTDQVGRLNNRSFTIETRPGAGTMIGTEAVARAAADGKTLLINAPFLLIGPHLRKLTFDPLTGLDPVCYLVSSPGVLAVNAASPYATFADLIQAVRARPGQMTFASAGPGTTHHIGFEKLRRDSGLDFIYVPFSGGGPAINALLDPNDPETRAAVLDESPIYEIVRKDAIEELLDKDFLPNSESKFLFSFVNSKLFVEEFGL